MDLVDAREAIKFASQSIEEIGLGSEPLSQVDLVGLEGQAAKLIRNVAAYRTARFRPPSTGREINDRSLHALPDSMTAEDQCAYWEGLARRLYKALQDAHDDMAPLGGPPAPAQEQMRNIKAVLEAVRSTPEQR